ncbi:cupin domain-containing protein [Natronorubrum halophilum]|uniref:cupin domain-containing protein n=1 Tax=Natronorubrum halophilum TaxID=1702106 RepID=UPI0010C18006
MRPTRVATDGRQRKRYDREGECPAGGIVFIRSGTTRWGVDGTVRETEPGETIITPGGVPHSWEVLGDDAAQVICVTAPPEADSRPGRISS